MNTTAANHLLAPLAKPLIARKMPFGDYAKLPALNQSLAKTFEVEWGGCPALFKHRLSIPMTESQAMREGRQFHSFMFEPEIFKSTYAQLDQATAETLFAQAKASGKSKAQILLHPTAKAAFQSNADGFHALKPVKDWKKAQAAAGKEVVTGARVMEMRVMRDSIQLNPEIMETLFVAGRPWDAELSLAANYEVGRGTGNFIPLKARLDYYRPDDGVIVDLKTCRTANPFQFARQVASLHYDLQAAWYMHVARLCGLNVQRFGFLAIDSSPPYFSTIHWLPGDWLDYAWTGGPMRLGAKTLLSNIHGALQTNRFPAYEIGELMPPEYILNDIADAA